MDKLDSKPLFNIVSVITILCIIVGSQWYLCPDIITRIIFTFHIPVLFIISGYFLEIKNIQQTLLYTFRTLMIPYFITCAVIIAIMAVRIFFTGSGFTESFHELLLWVWAAFYGSGVDYFTPAYIRMIGSLCFLPALFFAVNITHLCLRTRYAVIGIVLTALAGFATSRIFWLPYSIQTAMTGTIFVFCGFMLREKNILARLKEAPFIPAVCFVLSAVYIAKGGGRLFMVNNNYGYGIWDWLAAFCACIFLFYAAMLIEQHCPRLTALGNRIGSHFMLIFCLHLTELNCFPWSSLLTCFNEHRITNTYVQAVLFFVIHILLITGGLLICLLLRRLHPAGHGKNTLTTESGAAPVSKRVEWVDMAKGTCILLMLYAHMPIDSNIRQIIFSFHMPAFMLLSGYFTKNCSWKHFFLSTWKGLLLPYFGIEVLVAFVRVWRQWLYVGISMDTTVSLLRMQAKIALFGMSYSSSVFTDIGSVFVIWFVICLFFARMLFIAILKLSREKEALTCILVAAVTIIGWYIGTHVAFLPESFDVSMTAAAFIYAGYLLNKYSVWQYLKRYPLSIVLTGCIWLLQIQKGGIELSIRSYPLFPLSLSGAVCGTVILCLCCQMLSRYTIPTAVLKFFGRNSLAVLGIHCIEAQFIHWEGLLLNADVFMQFLMRMICICATLVLWIAIKTFFQSVILKTAR